MRLQLARTLVLVARARAGSGAAGASMEGALRNVDLELLEGAMLAADAAMALFRAEGGCCGGGSRGMGWAGLGGGEASKGTRAEPIASAVGQCWGE